MTSKLPIRFFSLIASPAFYNSDLKPELWLKGWKHSQKSPRMQRASPLFRPLLIIISWQVLDRECPLSTIKQSDGSLRSFKNSVFFLAHRTNWSSRHTPKLQRRHSLDISLSATFHHRHIPPALISTSLESHERLHRSQPKSLRVRTPPRSPSTLPYQSKRLTFPKKRPSINLQLQTMATAHLTTSQRRPAAAQSLARSPMVLPLI